MTIIDFDESITSELLDCVIYFSIFSIEKMSRAKTINTFSH